VQLADHDGHAMLVAVLARLLPPLTLALALVISAAATTATAAADEKNPAVQACVGKAEGAPCSADRIVQHAGRAEKRSEPGSCQPDECCELDYSGGSPPKTTCGPCLACKPGAAPAPDGDTAGATGVEPPRTDGGDPPVVAPNEKRGCSVAGNATAESALWLLGLSCLGWRRRRG